MRQIVHSFTVCFCLVSISVFSLASAAEDVPLILLNDINEKYEPGNHILIFEDKTGEMTFNQVRSKLSSFRSARNVDFGTTSSAIWCVIRVKNNTQENWFVEIGKSYIDLIDFYCIDKDGKTDVLKTGLLRNFKQRYLKVNHYILPLNIDHDEEKIYFIRAQSYSILKLPLVIGTLQSHYEINHKKDFGNGIYFGLILALSLYNFFVFISLRDKTYLYYVFYINFLGATVSWLRGYSPEFLNSVPPFINHGNNYAALAFIFLALFTTSFLNLKKITPKLRWAAIIFYILSLVSVICMLMGKYYVSFSLISIMVAFNFPYIAFFGIYAFIKGFRPAAYYILGFTFFTLGDFIFLMSENATIQQNLISDYSLQIGSAIEAIILSFALANKLNVFKTEKEETQARALAQAGEFTKELIRTQEYERKRIAGELHDSVGQSLSLLKNRITMLKKKHEQNSLDELNEVVGNTIQEVRTISYGLRPFQLDILGLSQSIRSLAEDVSDSGTIKFITRIDNIDGFFPKEAEINIFRIVQECLSNILRHSHASEAKIEITKNGKGVEIGIEDNGTGIENRSDGSGFGLIGIKERVKILEGKLEIGQINPKGTRVKVFFEGR